MEFVRIYPNIFLLGPVPNRPSDSCYFTRWVVLSNLEVDNTFCTTYYISIMTKKNKKENLRKEKNLNTETLRHCSKVCWLFCIVGLGFAIAAEHRKSKVKPFFSGSFSHFLLHCAMHCPNFEAKVGFDSLFCHYVWFLGFTTKS